VASNYTTLDPIFKQRYAEGIEDLTYVDRPLYALWPKKTDIAGASSTTRAYHVPLKYANTAAVSGLFSQAQTRSTNTSSLVVAWEIYTMHQYGFINLDMESLLRSEGRENAFVDEKGLEMDAMIENIANRLHHFSYLDGTGSLANVGNATQMPSFATSVMVLNLPSTAVYFMPGDELTASLTNSGGTPRALGSNNHGWYVIGTNIDAGTFTVGTLAGVAVNLNDAADGIPTATNGDFIQHRGDVQVAGTLGGTVITGFQGYIPSTANVAQLATSLYGVNRNLMPDFLAGTRFDGSSMGIEEAIMRGTNQVAFKGGTIKQVFLNHKKFSDLVSAISARGMVNFLEISPSEYPEIGFEGVKVIGAKGSVDVIPDYACPTTLGAGMDIEDWEFASVGEPIRIMNGDGLEFLRLAGADGIQAYWASYANCVPKIPRNNLNLTLAA
jgi:hypothetical protein